MIERFEIGGILHGRIAHHVTSTGPIYRASLYGWRIEKDLYKVPVYSSGNFTMGEKVGRYIPPSKLDPSRGWNWDFPASTDLEYVRSYLHAQYVERFIALT